MQDLNGLEWFSSALSVKWHVQYWIYNVDI